MLNAPVITTREAETSAIVKDGNAAIFMTPHVVMNDQPADSLRRHQRDKFQEAKTAIDSILPQPQCILGAPCVSAVEPVGWDLR